MCVTAIKPFIGRPKDGIEKFHGNQLVYVGWDQHLLFYSPITLCLPPAYRFGDLLEKNLPEAYGAHPDFARIQWSDVRWTLDGAPWSPDLNKSLADNGVGHKSVVRFKTPGLEGMAGCGF